jgi:hypothetical protein
MFVCAAGSEFPDEDFGELIHSALRAWNYFKPERPGQESVFILGILHKEDNGADRVRRGR